MSDRSQDELRKRFNRSADREPSDTSAEESDPSDDSDTFGMSGTSKTNETDGTSVIGETDESRRSQEESSGDGDGLKERTQVAMYLPADQRSAIGELYEELDARSTLAGDGGLQKNREFYEGLVEFILNHREEFAASLGINIDE